MNPIVHRYAIDLFFRDLKRTRKEVKKMIRKKMLRKNTIKTYGDADYLIVSWWKNKN